jgi:hypothetical protein
MRADALSITLCVCTILCTPLFKVVHIFVSKISRQIFFRHDGLRRSRLDDIEYTILFSAFLSSHITIEASLC